MMINHKTIDKILKEILPDEPSEKSIKIEGVDAQNAYMEQLFEDKFKNVKQLSASRHKSHYYQEKESKVEISFNFPNTDQHDYSKNNFRLRFRDNYLSVVEHYTYYYVSDILFVKVLKAKYNELYAEAKNKEIKKGKIKQLKTNAILASVKEIAKELKVDYNFTTQVHRIVIAFKISKKNSAQITVPYKTFQEVVPLLKTTLVEIMELQNKGLDFSIKPNAGSSSWLKPETE